MSNDPRNDGAIIPFVYLRRLSLLLAIGILAGCAFVFPPKPKMPLAEGIIIFRAAQTLAPTILLVPGCGGMNTNGSTDFYPRIAKQLNDNGFNAVILDYVKIMGQDNACLAQIKFDTLVSLITEALDYTSQQPFVDRQHISLLGWSLGGSGVLTVAAKMAENTQPNIKAVAAYYPGCYDGLHFSVYPTLLLLGLADNVVNPNDCLALAQQYPQAPLRIKTYPGAQHSFDVAEFKQAQTMQLLWKTFTSEYQEAAAKDSMQVLLQFLKENN